MKVKALEKELTEEQFEEKKEAIKRLLDHLQGIIRKKDEMIKRLGNRKKEVEENYNKLLKEDVSTVDLSKYWDNPASTYEVDPNDICWVTSEPIDISDFSRYVRLEYTVASSTPQVEMSAKFVG